MYSEFIGKVVLITGAASGIGRATAVRFAETGTKVVVADVDQHGGEQTVQRVQSFGGTALFVRADVSKEADVAALVQKTIETFGRLDYAVNNAGIEGVSAPLTDIKSEDFDRVINVNLRSVWLCMKYELPELLKQGGAIVNMSSVAGLVGFSGSSPYVASKHAIVGLTKTAALEYSKQGVRINAINPGVIMTPMIDRIASANSEIINQLEVAHPIGRTGNPEEIAAAVVWLCSNEASFITGVTLPVDGGFVAQ